MFALLKDLKLPDSDAKPKAGQLFKTTLAKSLLSSTMAALEAVLNRLKRVDAASSPAPADRAALQELEPLLAAITSADFSKYQRLLKLTKTNWSWRGQNPKDRIVLFTGRRETQRFLVEHLAADLDLSKGAVVGLDGAMPDEEQARVVEQSRRQDNSRPELEYLWDLHPLVDWLADRGQITFPRHHAPVPQFSDGLDPGAVVMVFQGTIPNQKGVPVVQEWVAVDRPRTAGAGGVAAAAPAGPSGGATGAELCGQSAPAADHVQTPPGEAEGY